MKDKTQKRQRIMDAALQVFVKSGYEKTKIIDVAQAAGIGKGTVYEYFESKEELFRCILEEYCHLYQQNVRTILGELEGSPCREKLLAVMRMENDLKHQVHLRSLNPVQLFMEFTNFPGLKQAIQSMLKFKFDTVCGILQEGIDSGEFRTFHVSLATAALMGAGSTIDSLSSLSGCTCDGEEEAEPLVAAEMVAEFTDENLLNLLICGLEA